MESITLEVIRNRLVSIADEMETSLLRTAYSPIVKEGLDASSAIFTPKGETIAQAAAIPIHLGCLIPAVQEILRQYPLDTMAPGDVFILNDPYEGGTHLPDIVLVMPVFAEGQVVALTCTMCHHQDIGGVVPGSLSPNATEIYQEGLRLPPMKLVDRGTPIESLFRIIGKNVRIPDIVLGDLRAQLAACHVGRRRIEEMVAEYGAGLFQAACDELIARSEFLSRERIAAIADGTYRFEDWLDDDGVTPHKPVRIAAAVTINGSDVHVDFTGTSPQLSGPFNCVPSSTMAAVYYVIRVITGADIPSNSGCFRMVSIHAPEGSMVNPRPPAAVNSRTAAVKRITDTLHGCFVQAMPGKLPAVSSGQLIVSNFGGIDPATGRAYITSELGAGGMGARPGMDGIDSIETDATNCMNIPAEAVELESPIRVRRAELWTDSGGAGQWRGGLGLHKEFEVVRGSATVTYRGERHTTQPWGVYGGKPATFSKAYIEYSDGRTQPVGPKQIVRLNEGERLHIFIGGGGGYGDPLLRPAEQVAEDVANRVITAETAHTAYGVVLQPDGGLDEETTARLRAQMKAGQPAELPLFNRGTVPGGVQA